MNTFKVSTALEGRTVTGKDSLIAKMPTGLYVRVDDGPPALLIQKLAVMLRQLSMNAATLMGTRLHHADWVITTDPKVVEELGMHGDPSCASCRAGVDAALVALMESEGKEELLVGTLHWTG